MRRTLALLLCCCGMLSLVHADDEKPQDTPKKKGREANNGYQPPYYPFAPAAATIQFDKRLPMSGLLPAVYVQDLCKYKYRATTRSAECQKFIDQGLGYFYSYVWMESVRSFETALKHDPECAFAWLCLARGLEKWDKSSLSTKALEKAKELKEKAGHRERLLITAKLQEKGMVTGVAADERKKKAAATLDELLTIYDDDEEGWFARAQINGGNEGAVFYKSLLKINPIHPGASHELVHFFENFKRPALGWPFAVAYIESSPKIPHAFHMQAHLATRIGKWDRTTDWSAKAVELEREYHKVQDVNPKDDHQFSHHMETLTRSLIHDGRFAEARAVKADAEKYGYTFADLWFQLSLNEGNWDEAEKAIAKQKRADKTSQSYMNALLCLEKGDAARAKAEVEVLQTAVRTKKNDTQSQNKLNIAQGWQLCQSGDGSAGLKLIQRAIEKTKDDYRHHAWGNGASLMEIWGVAALQCGNAAEAEEAFLEALAHDAGSAKAALGLYALCAKLDRKEEADRYLTLAKRCWARADSTVFENVKKRMTEWASKLEAKPAAVAAGD